MRKVLLVLRRFFPQIALRVIGLHDRLIINRKAEKLNQEAEDVLDYQADVDDEENR